MAEPCKLLPLWTCTPPKFPWKTQIEPLHKKGRAAALAVSVYFSPPSIVKWWPNMPSMAGERIRMS